MNFIVLVIIGVLILIFGYRFYGVFIVVKVLVLDEIRKVLFEIYNDGKDYVFINKWVFLGYYFVVIVGVGFFIGLVLVV